MTANSEAEDDSRLIDLIRRVGHRLQVSRLDLGGFIFAGLTLISRLVSRVRLVS